MRVSELIWIAGFISNGERKYAKFVTDFLDPFKKGLQKLKVLAACSSYEAIRKNLERHIVALW